MDLFVSHQSFLEHKFAFHISDFSFNVIYRFVSFDHFFQAHNSLFSFALYKLDQLSQFIYAFKALKLFPSQGVYDFENDLSDSCFEVKPIYPNVDGSRIIWLGPTYTWDLSQRLGLCGLLLNPSYWSSNLFFRHKGLHKLILHDLLVYFAIYRQQLNLLCRMVNNGRQPQLLDRLRLVPSVTCLLRERQYLFNCLFLLLHGLLSTYLLRIRLITLTFHFLTDFQQLLSSFSHLYYYFNLLYKY